ncbi:Lsa36 family surface (lipo)protein [Leptospira kmetyi]|uniref:Porin n=1 Tax=Leptospira kmetyi TaxID=408139 RepID=A0A5F1XSS5_9LEPT|nr:hypothetical protein [Leptospira kmetyi]AYV55470.1 hypothetical protein EFP84_08060 [Leptospira kmetyi]PJZ29450.1 hypothetical protein CH378_12905 [Leptospira kmetyi]TGK16731.1 hypothetical protein EHO62_13525 [Leptospira kmetyi]TGK30839.1 hypothetical protein EHO66_09700 [Leptospira kmetyi]
MKHYVFIILFLFLLSKDIRSEAFCVGVECASIPNEITFGANLIDPALDAVYTKEFLLSMGESAVLQNINSSLLGGTRLNKGRIGLGYSVARTNLSPRNYFFENSELRELPKQGIAASPSVNLGVNLGTLFSNSNSELYKWNLHFHYFPYQLSEQNVPFLKLRKTDLHGKVANSGLNLRYFPFAEKNSSEENANDGLSFGFGLYQSLQTIHLHSYDRRPTNINLSGQRRKWIGINDLSYNSNLYSATVDFRYAKTIEFFTIYGGLGAMYNQGTVNIQVDRNVALSSSSNRDDFLTNPTLAFIDLKRNLFISHSNWYGTIGMEFRWKNANFILEYLKNQNSESVSAGAAFHF